MGVRRTQTVLQTRDAVEDWHNEFSQTPLPVPSEYVDVDLLTRKKYSCFYKINWPSSMLLVSGPRQSRDP